MNDRSHTNDLMNIQFAQLARHLEHQMPQLARNFLGPSRVTAVIERQLHIERERCQSVTFAANFAKGCPVEGAREEDYLQSLWMCGDALVLTGIRFRGGCVDAPFVDLLATTVSWDDRRHVHVLLDAIFERYKVFAPRAVRVLWQMTPPPCDEASWRVEMDQVIVVGDPSKMAARSAVRLTPVEDLKAASQFVQRAYDEVFEAQPHLEEILCPASLEDLEQCKRHGHVYWIGDRTDLRCGLLATEQAAGPIAEGQCVIEEVIARRFQGQALATGAQQALAQVFVRSGVGSLIWGTIDAQNVPSRRTATRAGREEVGAWYWISPR